VPPLTSVFLALHFSPFDIRRAARPRGGVPFFYWFAPSLPRPFHKTSSDCVSSGHHFILLDSAPSVFFFSSLFPVFDCRVEGSFFPHTKPPPCRRLSSLLRVEAPTRCRAVGDPFWGASVELYPCPPPTRGPSSPFPMPALALPGPIRIVVSTTLYLVCPTL